MNERLEKMRNRAISRDYKTNLNEDAEKRVKDYIEQNIQNSVKDDYERMTEQFVYLLSQETPVLYPDEKIAFTRTVASFPSIYSDMEFDKIKAEHYIHEAGYVCNICPDYEYVIDIGLNALSDKIKAASETSDAKRKKYSGQLLKVIDSITDLSERYRKKAEEAGLSDIAGTLAKIPVNGASTFKEALQFFRILHFSLWMAGSYHNVVGRFDQFMYKYYIKDINNGSLTRENALELLEEFFISFNKDSNLYPGVQQGDNGQSLVLGGYILDGDGNLSDGYNELSALCLEASLNIKLIDPKINLRVNKNTPFEVYKQATMLTKQGLGFPQYSNDDVVIKGLVNLGYDYSDVVNYVAAACWEFIIPGKAMDIPNIGALSFVKAVNNCTYGSLKDSATFEEFFDGVKMEIGTLLNKEVEQFKSLYIIPSPVMTLFHAENIESLTDISEGAKYNNFGVHGTGTANAADSLFAIKHHIFDKKDITSEELINAMATDFEGNHKLRNILKYDTPKMGDDNDEVDSIAASLLETFADKLLEYKNERGGIYRGGTGSAMYYIWHSANEGASADGRRAGEAISANYSPSLDIGSRNPLSVINSFTKPDICKAINGGPLTVELHDSVFRNDDGIEKTAMLVNMFIKKGGHQLQINAVDREKLLDAKVNPDAYRHLIVRVWGWSGYFVELDEEYQEHIIKRAEYNHI